MNADTTGDMRRLACGLVLAAALAGCGSKSGAPITQPPAAKVPLRVAASAADVRFARLVAVDGHEDLAADALGTRKAASAALSGVAEKRAREQAEEVTLATRFLKRAHADPAAATAGQRRAWAGDYAALVDVAGWRFDVAFTSGAESRDRSELAAARTELRTGDAGSMKALARKIAKQRAAEITALRDISA